MARSVRFAPLRGSGRAAGDWHRDAMRRAAAMATMALAGMPIACGASTTAMRSLPAPSSSAASAASSAAASCAERGPRRAGGRGAPDLRPGRPRPQRGLGGPAHPADPRASRAPSRPAIRAPSARRWLRCSSTRSRASTSPRPRTLARIGSTPAYAPVSGTIRSGRHVVGRFVLAVSDVVPSRVSSTASPARP